MAPRRRLSKISSISKESRAHLLQDAKNVQLLALLRADPRAALSELARRMKMSAPAVRERLLRLEESRLITAWRIDVDPTALGYPVLAFVRVRPLPGQLPKIAQLAQRLPQIVECHRVTGEDCFIMKVYAAAIDEFDGVLDQFLVHGQTTTSIVQSTPVPPRDLPLPGPRR